MIEVPLPDRKQLWKILLVEDDEDDYILARAWLSEAKGTEFDLAWAHNFETAIEAVESFQPDVVLVDYDLGARNGLELTNELLQRGLKAPILLLTGRGGYDVDLEAMQAGVTDYIPKSDVTPSLLERSIRYAIRQKNVEEALRKANASLEVSNELLEVAKQGLEARVRERTRELAKSNTDLRAEIVERQLAEQRLESLAEFSRLVAEAGANYHNLLELIPQTITEMTGDACVLTLLSDEGRWLNTISVAHSKPEQADRLRQNIRSRYLAQEGEGLRSQVVSSGRPLLIADLPTSNLSLQAPDVAVEDSASPLIHSLLLVPLRAQSRILGTLGLSREQPGRPFTQEDQAFVQELADRAALAILNAGLVRAIRNELSERKRIEAELAEVRRRLMDRVEAERLELAQDLHDGPMQELYGLVFSMGALRSAVSGDENLDLLDQTEEKLKEVIQTLRSTAGELRPPALAPYGLEKAIRSHAENLLQAHDGMELVLDLTPDEQLLSERVRLALFRIYQVALTNVVRHAQATRVVVRFELDVEQVLLEVIDNGLGFEVPERWYEFAQQGHLGLAGAAERAEAIGGWLEVSSQPGQGTHLRVAVPRQNFSESTESAQPEKVIRSSASSGI